MCVVGHADRLPEARPPRRRAGRRSSGSPSKTVTCSRVLSSFQTSVSSSHAHGDRFLLEVVAEAPVAEHLEEGVVVGVLADVVEVVVLAAGADALLRVRRPLVRRLLGAEEDGLNWFMPALANSSVGSSCGTTGDDGTNVCPCFLQKKSMNCWRISLADGMG